MINLAPELCERPLDTMTRFRLKSLHQLQLGVILLLAFGLRVYQLGQQSLRGDEAVTYVFTSNTWPEMLNIIRLNDPHPPLYYMLTKAWLPLAGQSEFALRFPAVIGSMLLIALLYAFTARLTTSRIAIFTLLLTALNPYQVFYAQDARSYTLTTLLGLVSSVALWQAWHTQRGWQWAGYGLFVLLGMYTHYYFAFLVVFQGLFLLWLCWQNGRWPPYQYVLAGLINLVIFLPWLWISREFVFSYSGTVESVTFLEALWRPLQAFVSGQLLSEPWLGVITIAVGIAILLSFWSLRLQPANTRWLIGLYLGVPILSIFLVSLSRPIFTERYLIIASPAFLMLMGLAGAQSFAARRRWVQVVAGVWLIAIIGVSGAALNNHYHNPAFAKSPAWQEALNYVHRHAKTGDALIYTFPSPVIGYYNEDRLPLYLIPYSNTTPAEQARNELATLLERHGRVWLIPGQAFNPVADQVEPWLNELGIRTEASFMRQVHVAVYESPARFVSELTPQPTQFAVPIELLGFRLHSDDNLRPGKRLSVTLAWQAQESLSTDYTVFTQVLGPDGRVYGQWDNPPRRGSAPTSGWPVGETIFDPYDIPLAEEMPPGDYRLIIGLYDSQSLERVAVLNPTAGDYVMLAINLTVEP